MTGKRSNRAVQAALQKLRGGLEAYDYAYDEAMRRIEGQLADQEELAKQALSWIVCAKRPLSTVELQHALAVEIGDSELHEDGIPDIDDIVSVCAGLVAVDQESGVTRLVHYTTQEYFQRTQAKWFPTAEEDISIVCATYLSFNVFDSGVCQTDEAFEERLRLGRLYHYAAHDWGYHAYNALGSGDSPQEGRKPKCAETRFEETSKAIMEFLGRGRNVNSAIQGLLTAKRSWQHPNYSQNFPHQMTALHLAAYFGVKVIVKALLATDKVNPDSKDSKGQTPLSWAARNGHDATVQLLLATEKVDPDSRDTYGRTPLSWAAEKGHNITIQLLLATDKVDPNSKDYNGWTPLTWATERGHDTTVQLLLANDKVDPDLKDTCGRTLLSWAAAQCDNTIVQLLLTTRKVDPNSKDNEYSRTPLSWAAENGYDSIVQLLLTADKVDPDSKDIDSRTPLSLAAENGHDTTVQLLLTTGKVDPDSKDMDGRTPLSWAAEKGHDAIVQLLLTIDEVDPNSKDHDGRTPLIWAFANGHASIVQCLLATNKVDF